MNMWTRTAALCEYGTKVMNNQIGEDNYQTSIVILTLFAEATRMPQS